MGGTWEGLDGGEEEWDGNGMNIVLAYKFSKIISTFIILKCWLGYNSTFVSLQFVIFYNFIFSILNEFL